MSRDLIEQLSKILQSSQEHMDRLIVWKLRGGELQNYPDGETLDDMIEREARAIDKLTASIDWLIEASNKGADE